MKTVKFNTIMCNTENVALTITLKFVGEGRNGRGHDLKGAAVKEKNSNVINLRKQWILLHMDLRKTSHNTNKNAIHDVQLTQINLKAAAVTVVTICTYSSRQNKVPIVYRLTTDLLRSCQQRSL